MLIVLLFFFWYCHKRGRETRLEKERMVDSEGRVIELDDDPMIESSGTGTTLESGNASSGQDTASERIRKDGPSLNHAHRSKSDAPTPSPK